MCAELTKVNLPFSKKDIPIPSKFEYQKKMTSAVVKLLRNMGWYIHFLLNPDSKSDKETFGFKSEAPPPQDAQKILDPLAKDLSHMVRSLKYKDNVRCDFQNGLKSFISQVKNSDEIFVAADKSRCYYKMKPDDYTKLVHNNVTKEYRKACPDDLKSANAEASRLATQLELEDRIQVHSENNAFISLKDHKSNFRSHETGSKPARLINPAKPNIAKVSKTILQTINSEIRAKTGLNQWQSTDQVLQWFTGFENKKDYRFFKYDVESFYPSIKQELLESALQWATSNGAIITNTERNIIFTSRKNFLFHGESAWVKKANASFDVTMGSFDGAEVCELVGLFLLNQMTQDDIGLNKGQFGIYRDDGLMLVRGSKREIDRLRKKIEKLFNSFGLKITTETGMKTTDFLDVTLNLDEGTFKPFRKDEQIPVYVNKRSNHPSSITKNIPAMIEKRVSSRCSNKQIFDENKQDYESALRSSGYVQNLNYQEETQTKSNVKRKRWKKIFWFNPPFNLQVTNKVGEEFLDIIDKNFPKGSAWHKHFNRHTVKLSYSCTKNVAAHINSHNVKLLSKTKSTNQQKECNCRIPGSCPVQGECLTKGLVYTATFEAGNNSYAYIGSTANTFKERYSGHKQDLSKEERNGTTLSKKVWELKNANPQCDVKISWKIAHKCHPLKAGMPICDVCLTEKTRILLGHNGPEGSVPKNSQILNKRSEIYGKCRHKKRFTLEDR